MLERRVASAFLSLALSMDSGIELLSRRDISLSRKVAPSCGIY